MSIVPVELRRLAMMQMHPLDYVERRVEHLDLKDDHHYAVRVIQQFVVPHHGQQKRNDEPHDLLIPVGYFAKTRLPDLWVAGPDGYALPVLNRHETGKSIALLFTAGWTTTYFGAMLAGDRPAGQVLWRQVKSHVAEIASAPEDEARDIKKRLRALLHKTQGSSAVSESVRLSAARLLEAREFWTHLDALVETRLIIARLQGRPGATYVITAEYTERFRYTKHGSTMRTAFLGWLGWIAIGIDRTVANFGRANSLWLVQTLPTGVEPVRSFWDDRRHLAADLDAQSVESDRVVAARYRERHEPGESKPVVLDAQISSSPSMVSAMALAALLLFIATYIYQSVDPTVSRGTTFTERDSLIALASIFAAVPAAVAGALAYGGQTFVLRMSRGPRTLLALLSGQAAFLSILISLRRANSLVEASSYALSIYSLGVFGVFGYIQYGPRWRKNRHSRLPRRTRPRSPDECRFRQVRAATVYLVLLIGAMVVFARCQAELRTDHFFTHEFPLNVWDAWWSWF